MNSTEKLIDKVCLITGGTGIIGRSIVKKIHNLGAVVIFTYKKNKTLARKIIKELGNENIYAIKAEVLSRKEIKKLTKFIKKKYNKIDILINNVGINKPNSFNKISDKDWDLVINTNLKSAFIVTQECMNLLKKSKKASIINIGSTSGQIGGPRTTHYAVSKGGLNAFTHNVAIYGSPYNIRCNCVSPGYIKSVMLNKSKNKKIKETEKKILLKRLGHNHEVADAVAYLSSDESSYITGQIINVNGGLYF